MTAIPVFIPWLALLGTTAIGVAVITDLALIAQLGLSGLQAQRLEEQNEKLDRQNQLIIDQNTYASINNRIAAIQRLSELQQEEAQRRYDEITRVLEESKSEAAQVFALEQLPEAMVMRVELVDPTWFPDANKTDDEPSRIFEYPNLRPLAQRLLAFSKEPRLLVAGNDGKKTASSSVGTAIVRALHRLGYGEKDLNLCYGDCIWDWVFDADRRSNIQEIVPVTELPEKRAEDWRHLKSRLLRRDPYASDRVEDERDSINLTHLRSGQLGGADLSGCNLAKGNLRGLELPGVVLRGANLRETTMIDVKLDGAVLTGAKLVEAVLIRAHFIGADLEEADLRGADLTLAQFQHARLKNARFADRLLKARCQGTDFSYAEMQGVSLFGIGLQGSNFEWAKLQGAYLSRAQLQSANLSNAGLQVANLSAAHLQGASLFGAQLQGADLHDARLEWANLAYSQLEGANLVGAKMQAANLGGTMLQGANLSHARLAGARLNDVYIAGCKFVGSDWSAETGSGTIAEVIVNGESISWVEWAKDGNASKLPAAIVHSLDPTTGEMCRLDESRVGELEALETSWNTPGYKILDVRWRDSHQANDHLSHILGNKTTDLLICEELGPPRFANDDGTEQANLNGVYVDERTYEIMCSNLSFSTPPFAQVVSFPVTQASNKEAYDARTKWKFSREPEKREAEPADRE